MSKVLSRLLKKRAVKLAFASGHTGESQREFSHRELVEGLSEEWREFHFSTPSPKSEFIDYFSISKNILALLSEVQTSCGSCGSALNYVISDVLNREVIIGSEIIELPQSYGELISEADELGVNAIFVDGLGLIDVTEKKSFYALTELEPAERACFVLSQLSGITIVSRALLSETNRKVFLVDGASLRDYHLIHLCSSCGKKAPQVHHIHDLLNLDFKDFPSYDHLKSSWQFLGLCKFFLELRGKTDLILSHFSKPELFLLKLIDTLLSSHQSLYYLASFPILNEFSKEELIKLDSKLKDLEVFERTNLTKSLADRMLGTLSDSSKLTFEDDLVCEKMCFKLLDNPSDQISKISRISLDLEERIKIWVEEADTYKYFLIDGLKEFYLSRQDSSSNIYSFLGFSKYFQDLFERHPISRTRGLTKHEFSLSKKNRFQGPSKFRDKEVFKEINDIRWRGLSLEDIFLIPIEEVTRTIGGLVPKLQCQFELLLEYGFEGRSLGDSLVNLSEAERILLKLIKLSLLRGSTRNIVVIQNVGFLLNSKDFGSKVLKLFEQIAHQNRNLILVGA